MQNAEARQLDRGQRVQEFATAEASAFPARSHVAGVIAAHSAAIAKANQEAANQVSANRSYRESTTQKNVAIKSLIELMRAINQTARSIDDQFPGIADQFRMPRYSDREILNYAAAFITAATPIAVEFTKRSLPESFLTDMQSAIDAVEAAKARQSLALANQTAATAALRLSLKQEQDTMRELKAIMRNQLRNEPGRLAAWESASRIERAPKRKKKTPTTPAPTP